MVAVIDGKTCIGCGMCVSKCPRVFVLGDGVAEVVVTPVPRDAESDCAAAVRSCPVEAIRIG